MQPDMVNADSNTLPKVVFMGTPEFAVASLQALLHAGVPVLAVVTAPDKLAGRGMHLQQSAVKKCALDNHLPVLQPVKLKDPAFLEQLAGLQADLFVVVAFRMLPEVVWNMPRMGTVNVHGSLLPQYRGAAPINWAIINGETETGVTTFRLKHAIDTGDMLMQAALPIGPHETAGELHDRMKDLGAKLLVETIYGLAAHTLTPIPQPEQQDLVHAPKIFTETCKMHPENKTAVIHNLVRGLSPYPGAFCNFGGKMLKVFKTNPTWQGPEAPAGTWATNHKDVLALRCSDGWLFVLDLQLEGKKRMQTADFLRGYRFQDNESVINWP